MSVVELDVYASDAPNGSILVTLTDADVATFEIRSVENGLGAGKFTIRRDHASATEANLAQGNFVKVRIPSIDPDPVWAFWLDEHDDTILSLDEEGAEVLTRSGSGPIAILGRARFLNDVWAPSPPASADRGSANEVPGYWRWEAKQYGQILVRFVEEGQNEPGIPLTDVTIDFDRTTDSDGVPWPAITRDVRFPIGTDGLQLLQAMAETGEAWVTCSPDLLVQVRQTRGRDLTSGSFGAGKVRLVKGVNIQTGLERKGSSTRAATHAIVTGSDNVYRQVVSPSYTSGPGRWVTVDYQESNDTGVLDKVGAETLVRKAADEQALEMEIAGGFDEAAGLYMPFKHFVCGDLITLHTGTAPWDYNEASAIVTGFRIVLGTVSDDSSDELAARSLAVVVELGGGTSGGFGDINPTPHSLGDDPYFTDGGMDGGIRYIRFRAPWSQIGANDGDADHDAYITLTRIEWDLFSFDNDDGSYSGIFGRSGEIVMLASKTWEADVDGTLWYSKHYHVGGWGIMLPILSADPDTSGFPLSASEAAQVYYNDVSNTIRWFNGTIWQDLGAGGGGGSGLTPNLIYAEMNTGPTGDTIEWDFDTFYDQDGGDITASITAALAAIGLTYSGGIFTSTEPGVWSVTVTFGALEAPGDQLNMVTLETSMDLNNMTFGWDGATMPFSPGGGTRVALASQNVYLRSGGVFDVRQDFSGTVTDETLTDYAIIAITRLQ